ncbi:class I SAM-dependent methyltransferase [soil metagenome]
MKRHFEIAHDILRETTGPGDIAIDATAGNGHDSFFLAKLVGPTGHVFAFDIQAGAIAKTRERIAGLSNVTLFQRSHDELFDLIPASHHGHVAAIIFNLGYQPGGDPGITTRFDTTITALTFAFLLLKPQGVLCVITYVSHPGGEEEADAVEAWMKSCLTYERFDSELPHGPRLYVVRKC